MRIEIPLLLAFSTTGMAAAWFVDYFKQPDCKGNPGVIGDDVGRGYNECYNIPDSESINIGEVQRADISVEYYSSPGCENRQGYTFVTDRKSCYNSDGRHKIRSFKLTPG